jgi:thiamine-phosphate pyrophosphorylase
MDDRRRRLADAHLYLVCDVRDDAFLDACLRGGVDIVQLRAKDASDAEVIDAGRRYAARCAEHGALFILNDRPDLVEATHADGVHVGQDDTPVDEARSIVGSDRIVGLSTHSEAQIDAVGGVDYFAVGPIHATPTKPGRPAIGLQPVRYAAARATLPFFAIGGIDTGNLNEVIDAGATRVVVVRALTDAADPEAAAAELKRVRVGA